MVESTLIDAYSLDSLSNGVLGHGSFEPTCAEVLMQNLALPIFDAENAPPYMIIKINDGTVKNFDGDRYEATRKSRRVNVDNVKDRYVLSVTNGVVRAVYEAEKWFSSPNVPGRYEFIGKPANKEIKDFFLNKRVPDEFVKKGNASPVLYGK